MRTMSNEMKQVLAYIESVNGTFTCKDVSDAVGFHAKGMLCKLKNDGTIRSAGYVPGSNCKRWTL